MPKPTYTNRELGLLLDSLEHRLFDENEGYLPRIDQATKKHNGRLTRVERAVLVIGSVVLALLLGRPELISVVLAAF